MQATRRLFVTVAEGATLFTIASWIFLLLLILIAPRTFGDRSSSYVQIVVMMTVVLVPDGLGAWWLLRRFRTDYQRNDARRAVTAFAVSAPVALGVGYLFGEMAGVYAEVVFGRYFVLPAVAMSIVVPMIFIPWGVVMWALHSSSGIGSVSESQTK
jgi:hypothetical protein